MLSRFAVGRNARRTARLAAVTAVFLLCAAAIMPLAPSFPGPFLDDGWQFGLNAALARHLVFGRDILFTFGPYGVVYTGLYGPATDRLAMAACALLAVAAGAGLALLGRGGRLWVALGLAFSLGAFVLRDPVFLMLPACFVALAATERPPRGAGSAGLLLLAASLGVLVLVKGTFGAASGVAVCAGALALVLRRRFRLAGAVLVTAPAASVLAWLAAHQPLSALPDFLHAQSRIIAGYTEAMSLPGPALDVGVFVAAAALLMLLNLASFRSKGPPGLVLGACMAVLLFLAFKAGFVRHDGHAAAAAGSLAVFGAVLALAGRDRQSLAGLAVAILAAAPIYRDALGIGVRASVLTAVRHDRDEAAGLLDRLRAGQARRVGYERALAAIRAQFPLPVLRGTTDIYAYGQSVLLANGLDWDPRPVLQSYSAYEPDLEAADARHLTGPHAPENIVFTVASIDNRLPSLDDGSSWLPLLSRYAPVGLWGEAAILRLQPKAQGTGDLLGPATRRVAELNRAMALPAGGQPLWARVDVAPTLAGRVLAVIFKPPPLQITMRFAGGVARTFRFVSTMGRAGFLLSPLVGQAVELLALEVPGAPAWADMVPRSVEIGGDPRFWRQRLLLTLSPVSVPQRASVRNVLFSRPVVSVPPTDSDTNCWLDGIDGALVDHAKPLSAGGLVRLTGWAFGGGTAPAEPSAVAITLRLPDRELRFDATRTDRPDVGRHFGQQHLVRTGFEALVDLGGLQGDGTLGIDVSAARRRWGCTLGAVHLVSGGA